MTKRENLTVLGTEDHSFYIHELREYHRHLPHAHLFHEIGFFAKGQGVLHFNGQDFEVRAPALHFCPPKPAWHGFDASIQTMTETSMAIYPEFLFGPASEEKENISVATSSVRMLDYFCNRPIPLVSLKGASAARASELINLMYEEYRLQLPGYLVNIAAYVNELLVVAMRQDAGIAIPAQAKGLEQNGKPQKNSNTAHFAELDSLRDPRIIRALVMMDENLQHPVSNATLADAADMQEKYFIRLFTSDVGASPQRYYLRLRLEAAAGHLIHTPMNIEDIAHLYGFKHRSHFHASFNKFFKTTPDLYRYIHRGKDR